MGYQTDLTLPKQKKEGDKQRNRKIEKENKTKIKKEYKNRTSKDRNKDT